MRPKITGTTAMYLAALADVDHPLHGLVKMLATLDPKFHESTFSYEPQDIELFLSQVSVQTALVIAATTGVTSFVGYPLWVQADDDTAQVPEYFPNSVMDVDGTPTQKTFAQWVSDQNHDLYSYDDNGTTKYFAGNFARHGLEFGALVHAEAGYSLLENSDARTKIEAQ